MQNQAASKRKTTETSHKSTESLSPFQNTIKLDWERINWDQKSTGWGTERKKYLTSSVLPELLGIGFKSWPKYRDHEDSETDTFSKEAMEWGTNHEDEAVDSIGRQYKFAFKIGLVVHPTDERFAASIDRFCFTELGTEILEVKCPYPKFSHTVPRDHVDAINGKPRVITQVLFQMECLCIDSALILWWLPTKYCLIRIYRSKKWSKWFHDYKDRLVEWSQNKKSYKRNPFTAEYKENKFYYLQLLNEHVRAETIYSGDNDAQKKLLLGMHERNNMLDRSYSGYGEAPSQVEGFQGPMPDLL